MKLVLTGGGESENFIELDKYFLSLLGDNPSLLYIPHAQKKSLWKEGRERIANVFSSVQFKKIEMCHDLSKLSYSRLKKFKAVYIDGGNTFELMSKIRETHVYEMLYRFLYDGGVINGDSAGAIILGSHLQTAHFGKFGDENLTNIISYQGLNFLGNWAIHCHYDTSEDQEIFNFSYSYGFPVIAIPENGGVLFEDGSLKSFGGGGFSVFKRSKKVKVEVGKSFKINSI